MGNHLFWSSDHLGREWSARAEFHKGPSQWVEVWITCVRDQKTVLSQTAAWCPAFGWDMRRQWYPRAPRPVPEATLAKIEGWLRSLAQQQQGEVSRG